MVKLIRFTGRLATSDTVYEVIEAKEAKNYYSYEGKHYSKKTGIIKVKGQGRSSDRRINNWEIVSPITEESDKYYYAPLISGNAVIDKTTLHIVHPEGYYTQKDFEEWKTKEMA